MGKASRGKRLSITRDDAEALRLAAEMILDPRLIETFQSIKLHARLESLQPDGHAGSVPLLEQPPGLSGSQAQEERSGGFSDRLRHQTPATWAAGMRKALRDRSFHQRLLATIEAARPALRRETEFEHQAQSFDLDESTRAQAKRAYLTTRERLLAEPAAPAWLALVMVCLARVIATNAHERFADETWDELTSFMYELERDFLIADGAALADKLLEFDHVFYEDRLAEIIGSRMPFGLVELACSMADSSLFKPSAP
ncbi:MAG: hypothetical protein L0H63_13595 [Nitrococcus sp.]|nr:hypothetical protein [Nitrococcus sp.]